ncbi:hypothetical protein K438DRAFT_2129632 [Mycena galopus ATCC 62051]|nr:hypothetical protein K438DRAFT_2129632 [Mycena galopus ATCC 62051]
MARERAKGQIAKGSTAYVHLEYGSDEIRRWLGDETRRCGDSRRLWDTKWSASAWVAGEGEGAGKTWGKGGRNEGEEGGACCMHLSGSRGCQLSSAALSAQQAQEYTPFERREIEFRPSIFLERKRRERALIWALGVMSRRHGALRLLSGLPTLHLSLKYSENAFGTWLNDTVFAPLILDGISAYDKLQAHDKFPLLRGSTFNAAEPHRRAESLCVQRRESPFGGERLGHNLALLAIQQCRAANTLARGSEPPHSEDGAATGRDRHPATGAPDSLTWTEARARATHARQTRVRGCRCNSLRDAIRGDREEVVMAVAVRSRVRVRVRAGVGGAQASATDEDEDGRRTRTTLRQTCPFWISRGGSILVSWRFPSAGFSPFFTSPSRHDGKKRKQVESGRPRVTETEWHASRDGCLSGCRARESGRRDESRWECGQRLKRDSDAGKWRYTTEAPPRPLFPIPVARNAPKGVLSSYGFVSCGPLRGAIRGMVPRERPTADGSSRVFRGAWTTGGRGVSGREHNEELLALAVARVSQPQASAMSLSRVSLPLGTGVWAVWNKEDGPKADPDRMQESIDLRTRCVRCSASRGRLVAVSRQGGGGFAESRYMELVWSSGGGCTKVILAG